MKIFFNTYLLISICTFLSICAYGFNQTFLFAFSTLMSGVTGMVLFSRILIYIETEFSFSNLLASSILISTGYGTYNTYHSFQSVMEWESFIASKGIASTVVLAQAHLFVVLFCFSVIVIGDLLNKSRLFIKNRRFICQVIAIAQDLQFMKIILVLSFLFSVLQMFLLASGQLGFLASGLTENVANVGKQVRPDIQILLSIVPLMYVVLGVHLWRIAINPSSSLIQIAYYLFILITQITWCIILGLRREVIYGILMFCFGSRIAFPKINGFFDKKQVWKVVSIVLPILFVGYIGFQVISFSRIISYTTSYKSLPLFERITFLAEKFINYQNGDNSVLRQGYFEKRSSDNYETRTFILSALALMMDAVDKQGAILGVDLQNSLIKSIPGALLREKYLFSSQEGLYKEKFSLGGNNLKDIADSLYLSAYIDFSWFGMFIYPVIILAMFNFLILLVQQSDLKILKLLYITNISYFSISAGEKSTISCFVSIRDLLLLFALLSIYMSIQKLTIKD